LVADFVLPKFFEDAMINNPTDPGQFECPRAFQTDQSWYEEYWYRDPAPRRPSFFNRSIASLGDAFQRLPVLLGQFAKIIRTGAVWDDQGEAEPMVGRRGEAADAGQSSV
jgi:hypothetical protein